MTGRDQRLRIVILGDIVRIPLGGIAWSHLQYFVGLARLGHDVYIAEDSNDFPGCYDPVRNETGWDASYGLKFAQDLFAKVGLGDRWAYHDAHASEWLGPRASDMEEVCRTSDIVLNMAGKSLLRPWVEDVPARVIVDTDPAFTQVDHLTDPNARRRAEAHTAFLTYGENIGREGCSMPLDGFRWLPTRAVVVPEMWPVKPGREDGKYTCVMQWESYPPREYEGRLFGMKSRSFEPFMDLPQSVDAEFELALGSAGAPREELQRRGWALIDPREPTRTPWTYQDYIAGSKAEFGIAKHGYAVTRGGWFSERSANYLASGRPVVLQDTGFTEWLSADLGVLPFTTPEEAVAAVEEANARYPAHAEAARDVAVAYFDYRKVLPEMLELALAQ